MKTELLERLACPADKGERSDATCGGDLIVQAAEERAGVVQSGSLRCVTCGAEYPILRGIPRFVPSANYASNFGFQWTKFARTQLDSVNGTTISRDRFVAQSGWAPEEMRHWTVLDGGCGSGRFAEIALSFGATVVALDYSSAIDALVGNFPDHPRLHAVQGNLLRLPFKPRSFDAAYSFGVLQHTPDAQGALRQIVSRLRPGGRLAVDIYRGGVTYWSHPRAWLRPITSRMKPESLFPIVERAAPPLLGVSRALGRLPGVGRFLQRLVPVANYTGRLPLNDAQLRDWAVLDTFDWLSPRYDSPQTPPVLERWLRDAGLVDVETCDPVMVTGRGRKV